MNSSWTFERKVERKVENCDHLVCIWFEVGWKKNASHERRLTLRRSPRTAPLSYLSPASLANLGVNGPAERSRTFIRKAETGDHLVWIWFEVGEKKFEKSRT